MMSLFIYSDAVEMAHQHILVVKNAYLATRNEIFSRMNVKILIKWLHKT